MFYIMCSWPIECSNEMAVRLVDGNQKNEGRVEYCMDGVWRGLSIEAAEVVCRQLGYNVSTSMSKLWVLLCN